MFKPYNTKPNPDVEKNLCLGLSISKKLNNFDFIGKTLYNKLNINIIVSCEVAITFFDNLKKEKVIMWIKKKGISLMIVIILILTIVLFMFIEVLKQADNKAEMPSVNQGNLDFSNWNQMQNGLISLNGEWEFYWKKILSNDEINDNYTNPDLMVRVPDVWNNYELNGKVLSGYGYATYRLKVKNAQEGKLISIRMPTVSTAYRLYIDDNLISSNGIVGEDVCHYTPEYQPKTLVFMPTNKDFNIILQIANFSYARGGAWYSITMGTVKAVENYDRIIIYKDMFLVGAFMIMAVFFLFLFIMYKEDKANLYFVLLCICALTRVGIYGDFSISRIIPMINYYTIVKMDYISIYWISTTYILLLGEIFSEHKSKKIHKIFVVYAVFMSIFTLVSPIIIFTSITYLIEGVTLVLFAYALAYSIMAFYIKISGGATAILIGSVTVLFASIHDVLYQNDYIHSKFGEFSTFAIFVLVLIQAVLLAKRFRDSLNETQTAKLAFLQAQIKPHFLYNTINTIISISRYDGEEARKLLVDFSSYLRHSFDFKSLKQTVPLKNEIELAKAYIDIEKARFEDDLEVNFEMDSNVETNVPILILQPIIENAVNHGVLPKENGGFIQISVLRNDKYLRFSVKDNGIGMNEEKLRNLFHNEYGSGVGLSNIDKRLKSLYGEGLCIKSVLGEGTTVEWGIPLVKLE